MKKESRIRIYLQQMRVKSWLKNVFVFFPLVFSLDLFVAERLVQSILLALSFCFISSAIYTLNDICDVENDRKHSVKKNRPIASGKISFTGAWILLGALAVMGAVLSFCVNKLAFLLILCYVIINLLYSKWLKHQVVLDCFCIAAGFVLRVLVGGTIVENGVSGWMFLTVVSMSLFMAFGKRKGELHIYKGKDTRTVLEVYEATFLNGSVFMCAGLTIVFYSLWSIAQGTKLIYMVPLVMFVVMRYLLLVFCGREEADPTSMILSDKVLLVSCGLCGILMVVLLYAV